MNAVNGNNKDDNFFLPRAYHKPKMLKYTDLVSIHYIEV